MTKEVNDAEKDAVFSKAVIIVKASGKVSAPLLQRKLNIGYEEAVHLIDLIKEEVTDKEGFSSQFSWPDDDTFRVVVARGKKIMLVDDIDKTIDIISPKNCNETTRQYFKVEVFGNIYCNSSINGDVIGHGKIECNQFNGEIREFKDNLSCHGGLVNTTD